MRRRAPDREAGPYFGPGRLSIWTPEVAPVEHLDSAAPTLVASAPNQLSLLWRTVDVTAPCCVEVPVTYALFMREERGKESSDDWWCAYTGPDCYAQVKNLKPGRQYSCRVEATMLSTWKPNPRMYKFPDSDTATFSTPCTAPCQPAPVELISRTAHEILVQWDEPEECGGADIQSYILAMSPPPGTRDPKTLTIIDDEQYYEVLNAPMLSFRATKLLSDTEYYFTVQAVNEVGSSLFSEPAVFGTKPSPCMSHVPERVVAEIKDDHSARVTWEPPGCNAGPILHYNLYHDGGFMATLRRMLSVRAPHCIIRNLLVGVDHSCAVTAVTSAGESELSAICTFNVPVPRPSEPLNPRVSEVTGNSFFMRWGPPRNVRSVLMGGYVVELCVLKEGMSAETTTAEDWCIIYYDERPDAPPKMRYDRLSPAQPYLVRVCAVWGVDGSRCPYSRTVEFETQGFKPTPPQHPHMTSSGSHTVAIEWGAPRDTGSGPILEYRLAFYTSARGAAGQQESGVLEPEQVINTRCCRATARGLQPATNYEYQVQAVNKWGASKHSETGFARTKNGMPKRLGKPRLMDLMTNKGAKLRWDPPTDNGEAIRYYVTHLWCLETPEPPSAGGHSLPDIRAVNATAAPLARQKHDNENYNSEKHEFTQWECQENELSVEGLRPDREYACQIRAVNALGSSEWSEILHFRSGPGEPGPPHNLTAIGLSDTMVAAAWDPPERDNGDAVTLYSVQLCVCSGSGAFGTWLPCYEGSDRYTEVGSLSSGRTYGIRARAHNSHGAGAWSTPVTVSTHCSPPDPPPKPTCSGVTSNSVKLKWQPPARDNGAPVLLYRARAMMKSSNERGKDQTLAVYQGLDLQCKADNLRPDCCYGFQVQAVNDIGNSEWSPTINASTKRLPPNPPVQLAAVPEDSTNVRISWEVQSTAWPYAEPVSHEIEAAAPQCLHTVKLAARSETTDARLQGLKPGTLYQVRMRSVGAEGCGHSAWSEGVSLRMPPADETTQGAPSPCLPSDSGGNDCSKPTVQDMKQPRSTTPTKLKGLQSKKARGPPAKQTPYASLQHWYNQHVDVMVYYLGLFALSAMLYELHLYLTADRPLQPPPFP